MGPLLADSVLGATSDTKESPSSQEAGRDVSSQLPLLLEQNQDLWKDRDNHLYTDSASSAGKYLETIHSHFKGWSVSYNKWTGPLETQAGQLPACAWSAEEKIKWCDGSEHRGQYGWLRYQPGGCEHPQLFAVLKHQKPGELFWQYAFVTCQEQDRPSKIPPKPETCPLCLREKPFPQPDRTGDRLIIRLSTQTLKIGVFNHSTVTP